MLHYRHHPSSVRKTYSCAAVAKLEGHDFFYFSPGKVDFENKLITGWVYENGEWIEKEMPFPDVIYNASGPKTEKQQNVYRILKQTIPFTSHSVGTKMRVYEKVKKGKDFAEFLIPYKKIETFTTIIEFIDIYRKVVIKPSSGNKGRNVFFLEKSGERFVLYDGTQEVIVDREALKVFYEKHIKIKEFLIQKYILCQTKSGFSYDFRMHMQKGADGNWNINRIYPRITGGDKPVNNISSGGFRGELEIFLKNEFGDESENTKKYLEQFAMMFTPHFESLYNKSFDELGLDVCLDENYKIRIFEVNWRPGSKTRELDFARYQIPYAAYLAKKYSSAM